MSLRRTLVPALIAGLSAAAVTLALASPDPKPAPKKAQTQPASKAAPQTQAAPVLENQPVQTKEGVTIRENYFMELPGIDLSTLTPKQKQRYLDRVNTEMCTCGCPNDTIARCLVNDPKCSAVRGIAEKVLSEVKAGK